ncbi:MAG TPA: flagellar protein FlgN [Desulfobulbus sp.]|nr:flagellar protein FlgN [Desulfobulbus sp.]
MTRDDVRELMIELRDLLLQERQHARELDIRAMAEDTKRKEALLQALNRVETIHPEDRRYAEEIKRENLRNAYLYKATLNWIQETMEFFGKRSVPTTYGQTGMTMSHTVNGRLLSGRI